MPCLTLLALTWAKGYEFETTIKNSPIGEKARQLNLRALVSAFHGHARNRMCQLRFLTTYVCGLGLEDLEGCERLFSKSKGLLGCTGYQAIWLDFGKRNLSVHSHIKSYGMILAGPARLARSPEQALMHCHTLQGKFLVKSYRQALDILDQEDLLHFAMCRAGISGTEVFEEQLRQKKEYLKNLSKEETDQMDEQSKANGTVKRHTRENYDKAVHSVQEMEEKMGIEIGGHGRGAVNKLEELVVKWLFELTKMNMSGTGYKLRKHIAKALQTQSRTIQAALGRYNAAAAALDPPRCTLSWSEVIDFTFLVDFDILRDPEGNAALRPWVTPGARELMDTYFKIEPTQRDQMDIEEEEGKTTAVAAELECGRLAQEREKRMMKGGRLMRVMEMKEKMWRWRSTSPMELAEAMETLWKSSVPRPVWKWWKCCGHQNQWKQWKKNGFVSRTMLGGECGTAQQDPSMEAEIAPKLEASGGISR
ncbi:hypothetical protein B0H13DRAFT_1886533 [Mycena leptocephala]|nr:hypothetical protein B0H13DRAFT_1886533 [Mycena leptocephala]